MSQRAVARTKILLSGSLKRFALINYGESRRMAGLEQALDLPRNVSEQAKRDLGNTPSRAGLTPFPEWIA
jgi:hypothetical protein